MNRGLIRGIGLQGEKYTPILANDGTTQPFCDGGTWGRYSVLSPERGSRICIGHANFGWAGAGAAGSGSSYYEFSLPLPMMTSVDAAVGAGAGYAIGTGLLTRIFLTHAISCGLYTLGSSKVGTDGGAGSGGANVTAAGLDAPGWATLTLGRFFNGGTGSFSASTTKTQAHGLGVTPDAWFVTSQAQASTGNLGATADATNLNLTAASSNSASYTWMAMRTGGGSIGPILPWAWGSSGDLIQIEFMYPVA